MIHEIDAAISSLVLTELGQPTDVEVVFDAPTKDWAARRNGPTIDVYLYDIREDLRRRQFGVIDVRQDDRTIARRQPARYFKLSYLLTAWTQRPEDEHRLLSLLLGCFLRHDNLPPATLVGSLADEIVPLPITMAIPPPEDRALSDVWSALGGELKPSLDLVVIAPIDLDREADTEPPVTEPFALETTRRDNGAEETRRARSAPAPS